MFNSRLINTKVAGGGGGCTDIVDNYDPFGDSSGLALYQLNGDATDVSGNYNGNFINPSYGTGVFGQAGVFAGTSSFVNAVDLPDSLAEAIGVNDFTFSMWINPTAFIYNGNPLIPISFVKPLVAYLQLNTDGTVSFFRYDGTGGGITSNISITTNSWYHIVAQQSSTDGGRLYINGTLVGQDSFNGNLIAGGDYQSIIGGYVNFTYDNFWFQGSIDQTRIFNRTLTPLEVEALYTEELCICDGTVDTLDILGDGSCIATYQLDGNANDLSGNYSGTPTDVSYGVGEFDLAGVFNGSSSYILANGLQSLYNSNQTSSISLWFKSNYSATGQHIFIDYSGNFNYNIFLNTNGTVSSLTRGPSGDTVFNSISTYNDGNWHHVVISKNNATLQKTIYIDNDLLATQTISGTAWSTTPYVSLGCLFVPPSTVVDPFNGSIDQVRIFNKALSAGEVTTLYNETACDVLACSGTTNTLDILGDGSCIAAYPLDGSPLDLSGNYNGVQTDVTYPQGYFDLAGSFNGSSSGINLPSSLNTSVIDATGAFSFSMWINANDISTIQYLFCSNTSNNVDFGINTNDRGVGKIVWTIYNTSYSYLISTTTITTNTWYNTVVTYNNGLSELFINGASQGTITKTLLESSIEPTLGYRNTGGSVRFNGSIDQVRIFNKALNQAEVGILYNNETPCN